MGENVRKENEKMYGEGKSLLRQGDQTRRRMWKRMEKEEEDLSDGGD